MGCGTLSNVCWYTHYFFLMSEPISIRPFIFNAPLVCLGLEFSMPHSNHGWFFLNKWRVSNFQWRCLDAKAWILEVIFQMLNTPISDTPTHLYFLWGDRKRSLQSTPAVSHWQTGEETLSYPPLPSPFLLEVHPHLSNPHFSLTIPPIWLASLFSLLYNKRNKGGRTTFPLPPTTERRRSGGNRPTGNPFQSCIAMQSKVSAC